MGRKPRRLPSSTPFEDARDELYSHILRCGVLEANDEHQRAWFDDTMDYMAERYPTLSPDELADVRQLGERYCKPVIPHGTPAVGAKQ